MSYTGWSGLKTHCKVAMVVRKEGKVSGVIFIWRPGITTSYSRLYEDIGIFTCDDAMGQDATDFNYRPVIPPSRITKSCWLRPSNLREKLEGLIRREMEHAKNKRKARLIFKANSLVDKHTIQLLYEASQAGVQVDLLVRGICSLISGIKDVSENIHVVSILGRYLEHSRFSISTIIVMRKCIWEAPT